ncbi:fimbrillin family protein [Phocaeicola plebeius]|uniref:fimbrillin family protein n=1 Tax=Phocaeicola plebeius TaxID=310297 RepID=UPI002010E949|nr:fimbrillin family protein [Phocaeicola plebeius]MCL1613985.1 fimbrillin family protein [Phocaeicola plebeius]
MRKTILFGLAAAMLVVACSEEDDLRQGIAGEGITFTSSVMSRATDTSFEAGDAIGVSMYTESGFVGNATNVQYTTEDGSRFTSTNPMTWGAAGSAETVDFKGVYPYKAEAVADGIYSFTLATGEGASLSDNDVMYSSMTDVAVSSKNVDLTFKHKLVKVVMQVYDQNRKLLPGATVKINNQQTSGTLNLADGTVTSTGTADATLDFASNPEVEGEYQTIVMPSAPTQGRVITITYNNVDYPCPVDMYAFDSGSKMIFSVTLNPESGTASQGTIVNATATVENWTEQRIESGWIFGAGESFEVEGKISYQLLTEPTVLSADVSHFGNFGNKQLDATDVYSLEYKRDNAADDATITISGKDYTLQKGLTAGTLLIAAENNTRGIDVTSKDAGIELTSVLVYTNENIGLPITLWTGDGSAGNGTVGDDVDSYPVIARITLSEEQQNLFVPGAILRCYLADGNDAAVLRLGTLQLYYSWRNLGIFDDDSNCLTNVLTLAMCDEVKDDGNIMIFGQNWSNIQLDRVELVPASDDEVFTNLLWCHKAEGGNDCNMDWGDILVNIPTSLKSGDIIRVTYTDAAEGAYLEAVAGNVDLETTPDAQRMLQKTDVSVGGGSVDFDINEETCTALLGLECRSLIINGENLTVHKIQLVRRSGE